MQMPLLPTKFLPAAVRDPMLPRPHLLARLDAGRSAAVTLISAPAGYGKSTLVSSWLDHRASTGEPKAGWLNLDEADNQFSGFLRYFIAAMEEQLSDRTADMNRLMHADPPPALESVAGLLIDLLCSQPGRVLLVLDNLHRITDSGIFAFLTRLIDYAPPELHLVLITRVDPPLPLNRWRATRRMHEIRLRDIAFALDETTAFFQANLERMPPLPLIETIHRRTEGWIAGSWLALLALRGPTNPAELTLRLHEHTNRYTMDYLVDEVLSGQPPEIQRFLICTAIFDRFCAELCAEVLDLELDTAAARIDYLRRENLFVIEADAPENWVRYHRQFQEMLLSRLTMRFDQVTIRRLRARAATWLAGRLLVDDAIAHLLAIPDQDGVAALIAERRIDTLNELGFTTLATWLTRVPLPLLNQSADLLLALAWIKRNQVENKSCLQLVNRVAELLEREPAALPQTQRRLLTAECLALQVASDKTLTPDTTLTLVRTAWKALRGHLGETHCSVGLALAYQSQALGELDLALEIVCTTLEEAPNWPVDARSRIAHAAGFFYFCRGDVNEAKRTFEQNLLLADLYELPVISVISRHGLGMIADACNQHQDAIEHHLDVVRRSHLTDGRDAVVALYSLTGIYAQRQIHEESRALMVEVMESAHAIRTPYFLAQMAALEAYIDLTGGEAKRALRWALSTTHREMQTTSDRIPIIRARVLLHDGSEACLLEADQILQGILQYYHKSHVWNRQVEALILQSLVQDALGRTEAAQTLLAQAVDLAVPKGGIGLFMGYGAKLERAVRALSTQFRVSPSGALLLSALSTDESATKSGYVSGDLPEALTERELAVLRLLAERYSNKEIARQLIISPHTVRNHTANIYGKLQVTNRRAAVRKAGELGLLPVPS